jgi:hypothetical protein
VDHEASTEQVDAVGLHPGGATLQATQTDLGFLGLQNASPLEPRSPPKHQRTEAPHDRVVGTKHGDARGDEHKSRHDRQQGPNYAQEEQADPDNCAGNVPQVSW